MGLFVGSTPVKAVYVGSTPVTAVYVGSQKVWPTIREVVQITLGTGNQARDQFRAALATRGLNYQTVTEVPFEIELVGAGALASMFEGCSALVSVPDMDTSQVTDMRYMFTGCVSLTSAPTMDTSQVTSMRSMFYGCSALTYVPDMDTSQVTSMRGMFYDCSSLTYVPDMDTSQVTDMGQMFRNCSSLTYVPDMDTSQVTDMYAMFYNCSALTDGNVRLIGRHPNVNTDFMIAGSGLTREPFYKADGTPDDGTTIEVHEVALTDAAGVGTVHPLLTVTVPAGETWSVRIQGTVTKADSISFNQPMFRIGTANSGRYGQGAAVDFSGTVTAANSVIAMVTDAHSGSSFVGTVTIEK